MSATGTWWPGLERPTAWSGTPTRCCSCPACAPSSSIGTRTGRFEAFRQDAPYLFDPAAPGLAEFDSGVRTVECTKRAAAFGLWGVWALFGRQLFADMVDVTFALGRAFYEKLSAAEDFVPLHEPQCNIVVFRHVPPALRGAAPREIGALPARAAPPPDRIGRLLHRAFEARRSRRAPRHHHQPADDDGSPRPADGGAAPPRARAPRRS